MSDTAERKVLKWFGRVEGMSGEELVRLKLKEEGIEAGIVRDGYTGSKTRAIRGDWS